MKPEPGRPEPVLTAAQHDAFDAFYYHGEVCVVCHHLIRVQINRGTGVCCETCRKARAASEKNF